MHFQTHTWSIPVNHDLGLGSLANFLDRADYWPHVRAKIDEQVSSESKNNHHIDVVILYGEEALSKSFEL